MDPCGSFVLMSLGAHTPESRLGSRLCGGLHEDICVCDKSQQMGMNEKQGDAVAALTAQQTSPYSLNAPQISGSMEENNNRHLFDIKSIKWYFGFFFSFSPIVLLAGFHFYGFFFFLLCVKLI